jgi:hypothetical protein
MQIFQGGGSHAPAGCSQRHQFGHPVLRVHQIRCSALCFPDRASSPVLPTGGRQVQLLCYQLPGLMAEGLTLVVSPRGVDAGSGRGLAAPRRGAGGVREPSLLTADERRAVWQRRVPEMCSCYYCAPGA